MEVEKGEKILKFELNCGGKKREKGGEREMEEE